MTVEESPPYSHLRHNASVTIKLMDVNEFNPEFNQTMYSAYVNEKDAIGKSVTVVRLPPLSILDHLIAPLVKLFCFGKNKFNSSFYFLIFLSFKVFATDKDRDFSLLTYSIIAGNSRGNFTIDNVTGQITIAKSLDRESRHQVILTVRAEDSKYWLQMIYEAARMLPIS